MITTVRPTTTTQLVCQLSFGLLLHFSSFRRQFVLLLPCLSLLLSFRSSFFAFDLFLAFLFSLTLLLSPPVCFLLCTFFFCCGAFLSDQSIPFFIQSYNLLIASLFHRGPFLLPSCHDGISEGFVVTHHFSQAFLFGQGSLVGFLVDSTEFGEVGLHGFLLVDLHVLHVLLQKGLLFDADGTNKVVRPLCQLFGPTLSLRLLLSLDFSLSLLHGCHVDSGYVVSKGLQLLQLCGGLAAHRFLLFSDLLVDLFGEGLLVSELFLLLFSLDALLFTLFGFGEQTSSLFFRSGFGSSGLAGGFFFLLLLLLLLVLLLALFNLLFSLEHFFVLFACAVVDRDEDAPSLPCLLLDIDGGDAVLNSLEAMGQLGELGTEACIFQALVAERKKLLAMVNRNGHLTLTYSDHNDPLKLVEVHFREKRLQLCDLHSFIHCCKLL